MIPTPTSRVDLHCHSSASQRAALGVARALGLPECATPPEEVHALAKRRGMDFVTITDHDTIDGVLEIADRPDVFVSEELTTWFRGEPQAVHVLCWGITPEDHEWLQAHARDLEASAAYLLEREIACALAHPFFAVAAPLTARHRRRLAQLFPVWETRNGARAHELNLPAATYIETHGGTGVGGSDDHGGVDIGRTFTAVPRAGGVSELLDHLRAGRASAHGEEGSAAKWAHAAMAIAARVLADDTGSAPDPRAILAIVERIVREGNTRGGALASDVEPGDVRGLLEAWLAAVGVEQRGRELLEVLQDRSFSHAALFRRARRAHERGLRAVTDGAARALGEAGPTPGSLAAGAQALFAACLPAIPYVPAAAFLGQEKARLSARTGELPRIALVADGIGVVHGVTRTLEQIRERGVPGFEVEVVGTDASVDRRLPAAAEVPVPSYPGLTLGVPGLPAVVEALAEGRYDAVHLCAPGPAGVAAALTAGILELPLVAGYHTELAAYAREHGGESSAAAMTWLLAGFYGRCRRVLSPSPAADESLRALGVEADRIARWDRGVDTEVFFPATAEQRLRQGEGGEIRVLYSGRLAREKGVELLADAFLAARARDRRLRLVVAGRGPEEEWLRERLGLAASFLGWLDEPALAAAYRGADIFLFASRTDTFGQVVLEAQASGLPVVAVGEGGPAALVQDGRTGLLCPPEASALAGALLRLADTPAMREELGRAAAVAARGRSWERALERLAHAYRGALPAQAVEAVASRAA